MSFHWVTVLAPRIVAMATGLALGLALGHVYTLGKTVDRVTRLENRVMLLEMHAGLK